MESDFEAMRVIGNWMEYCNDELPRSSLAGDRTPMEVDDQRLAARRSSSGSPP